MTDIINSVNSAIWAMPVILMLLFVSIAYLIGIRFGTLAKFKLQWDLLVNGSKASDEGISPLQTFCSVIAYRVAVGNVGGVAVAIMYGGPGAPLWMIFTALCTSAIAYAENSLGQIYKVRQDGQYRGGPYNYIESGLGWKPLAVLFALFATVFVSLFLPGAGANNIGMAFQNSFGIRPWITGIVVATLLFLVISGGVRRIATFATLIVPVMTILYLAITVVLLIANANEVPAMIKLIVTSAFNKGAVFGGMLGVAVQYGVKRAVNSSGAGMGDTPCMAAAAESLHPAEQGLVNAFTVFIDVAVCICTSVMILITDCFNVLDKAGNYFYIGSGSPVMAEQAASGTAGVVWVQEAANSVLPGIGGIIIALSLTFFAFSTTIAYYYEGESGLAYLLRKQPQKTRNVFIWALRILMPILFFTWFNVTAATAWAISEIGLGVMIWINGIALIFLFPKVIKVYNDFFAQKKAGVERPFFNPQKLGIKNCDVWMDINKDLIAAEKAAAAEKAVAAEVTSSPDTILNPEGS